MNEIKKPKDILLATLSNPNSTVMDLLKNDITAENTGLLLPEEYKNLDFIKKTFSNEDGVFDDQKFTSFYKLASEKYADLTNKQAYESLKKDLEYSPTSMVSPLGGKKFDVQSNLVSLKNPERKSIGISGINQIEESGLTREELVQGNKYWDTELNKWSEKTVEEQGLFDKFFGDTLVIAKWQEDGVDENGIKHRKGDWKTDPSGNYFAETIGGRQLLDSQVISVQDILTKEGSWINKYDFFDSDGETKSVTGTVFKTMAQIAPYLIPGVNKYYGALTASVGLASVLPTFYKSIEGLLTGKSDSALSQNATELENWFRKYDTSKSQEGRSGFWNLESLGDIIGSTMGQLYQQKAAASLSKYIIPKELGQEVLETTLKRNKLAKSLSLGYMAMISASDTYNEALNAGYDERTAGFTSLLSASALYGIMNYNEGVNGLGTWFLDKTTGYNQEVSRGAMRKVIKPLLKDIDTGVKAMSQSSNPTKLISAVTKFKSSLKNIGLDLAGATEGMWKNALIEGVEEVSEEAIQDTIKGMVDSLSWMGITPKEGSFGGFKNVFSKEGLSRYVATFVGGGIGGALFDIQQTKIEPFFNPELKQQDANLVDFILRGQTKDLISEVNRFRKSFNDKLSPELGEYNGQKIFISSDNGKSSADIIADQTIEYIRSLDGAISMEMRKGYKDMFDRGGEAFKNVEKFDEYVRSEYKDLVTEVIAQQQKIKDLEKTNPEEFKNANEELKNLQEKLNNFFNGDAYLDYLVQYGAYTDPGFRKMFSNLDVEGYTYNVYGLDYNNLDKSQNPGKITKDKIDKEYADYFNDKPNETFGNTLKPLGKLYLSLLEKNSKNLKEWSNNKNQQDWLKTLFQEFKASEEFQQIQQEELNTIEKIRNGELSEEEIKKFEEQLSLRELNTNRTLLKVLKKTPGIFTISNQFDSGEFVDKLLSSNFINIDSFDKDEQKIVKEFINSEFSKLPISNVNRGTISEFIESLNERILEGDTSNMYIKKLQELFKDKESEKSGPLSVVTPKEINILIENFDPEILTIKGNSIIDEIKTSKFIDSDLLSTLDKIFNTKLVLLEGLENLKLDSKYENSEEDLSLIDQLIDFVRNNDEEIINIYKHIKSLDIFEQDAEYEKQTDEVKEILLPILDIKNNYLKEAEDQFKEYKEYQKVRKNLKTLPENPIKTIAKNIFKRFNRGEESDIFDFLISSEKNINKIPDISDFLYNRDDQKIFDSVEKTLNVLAALIQGTTSMNPVIVDYLKAYHPDKKDKIDSFQVLNHTDTSNALGYLNQILQKFRMLETIHKVNDFNKFADDIKLRKNSNDGLVLFYENELKFGNKILIPAKKYDVDTPIEKFILEQELAFYNNTKDLSITDKKKLLDELINNYTSSNSNESAINNIKATEIAQKDGTNSGYILRRLAQTMDISPEIFLNKFKDAIADENLMPLFDQETALRYMFNSIYSESKKDKVLPYLNEKLYKKYSEIDNEEHTDSDGIKYVIPKLSLAHNLNYMDGAAGSGKTTITRLLYKMLGNSQDNLILSAPTEQKTKDLSISILNEENKAYQTFTENGLFSQIYNSDTEIQILKLRNEFLDWMGTFSEQLKGVTSNQVLEFKTTNVDKDKTKEVILAKVNVDIQGDNISINSFDFNLDFLSNAENDKLIVIDEATLLDPFTIAILNNVKKTSNSDVILIGDKTQKGFETKINNATHVINTNKFYTNRTPSLVGKIRVNNTGKYNNSTNLYRETEYFTNGSKEISIRLELAESTRTKLSSFPLIYRRENINDQVILQGDEIVQEEDKFKKALFDIVQNIETFKNTENPKSLKILLSDHRDIDDVLKRSEAQKEDESLLTKLLSDLGLSDDQYSFYYENDVVKGIQGNEADYVILYNLKADNKVNIDTDLQAIYTYATRSKDYTLIYEPLDAVDPNKPLQKGLFTANGLVSKFDKDIREQPTESEQISDKKSQRLEEIDNILTDLKPSEIVQEESKESEIKSETSIEEDEDEDITPIPDIHESDEYVEVGKEETQAVKNIQKEHKKWFDDHKNGMIFDSYYTRLGIPKSDLDKKISTSPVENEDLKGFVKIHWGKKINGVNINKDTTWRKAAQLFEAYKYHLIESDSKKQIKTYQLSKRTLDSTLDYAYNKDNDRGFGNAKNVYSLKAVTSDGLIITLGAIRRYNLADGSHLKAIFENVGDATLSFDIDQLNIKKLMEVNDRYTDGQNNFFIQITGLRDYRIDPNLNPDVDEKLRRLPLNKLQESGYVITTENPRVFEKGDEGFKEFLQWYEENRFEKLTENGKKVLKKFYYNRLWIKVAKNRLDSDLSNSLWETPLAVYRVENKYPTNDKKTYGLINALLYKYFSKEEYDAIKKLPNVKIWLNGSTTHELKKEFLNSKNLENHKQNWIKVFEDLKTKINEDPNLQEVNNTDAQIKDKIMLFIDSFQNYAFATKTPGTNFVKITYDILQSDKINAIKALNKTKILDDYYVYSEMIIKSPSSGENELTFEWNDASNLYIDRVFETPRFLIDFDVFNIGEKTSTKTISESDEIQLQEVQEDSEINLTSEESQIIGDFINTPTDDIDQDLLQKYINSIQNNPDKKEEISKAIVEAQGNLSDYINLC